MKKLSAALICLFFAAGPAAGAPGSPVPPVIGTGDWQASFPRDGTGFYLRRAADPREEKQFLRFSLVDGTGAPGRITAVTGIEPPDGKYASVTLDFSFPYGEGGATVVFSEDGLAEIKPGAGAAAVRVEGEIRYGFLPGFFLEDIIYDPADAGAGAGPVYVPPENIFGAFLGGGDGLLLLAWPGDGQSIRLLPGAKSEGRATAVIEVALEGKELHAGLLAARGIWHEIRLRDEERRGEATLAWEKPFEAEWRTQLTWSGIETVFLFREGRRTEHRLGGGLYPAWFEEGQAFIFPGSGFYPAAVKTVIYPFDGHQSSLFGFLNRTPLSDHFAEIMKTVSCHPAPARYQWVASVGFTACWGTGLLRRSLMSAGIQDREQAFLDRWLDSVVYSIRGTQYRRERYGLLIERIAARIEAWLAKDTDADTGEFLGEMSGHAAAMKQRHHAMVTRDGRETPAGYVDRAQELAARMREIITIGGRELSPEYDYIVRRLNHYAWQQQEDTGGYRGGGYGHHWRDWFFQAGRLSGDSPLAAEYARVIRGDIREFLKGRRWETIGIR